MCSKKSWRLRSNLGGGDGKTTGVLFHPFYFGKMAKVTVSSKHRGKMCIKFFVKLRQLFSSGEDFLAIASVCHVVQKYTSIECSNMMHKNSLEIPTFMATLSPGTGRKGHIGALSST